MIGTGAAHLFVEIDHEDTNLILRLWHEAPNSKRQLLTTGLLKASHRELDEQRSTEGNPYRSHARAVPVEPGKIEEYVLRLYPFAATLLPGHKLTAELMNNEPMADEHNSLLHRMRTTCPSADRSCTKSTVMPCTPPGWYCRSPGVERRAAWRARCVADTRRPWWKISSN